MCYTAIEGREENGSQARAAAIANPPSRANLIQINLDRVRIGPTQKAYSFLCSFINGRAQQISVWLKLKSDPGLVQAWPKILFSFIFNKNCPAAIFCVIFSDRNSKLFSFFAKISAVLILYVKLLCVWRGPGAI